MSADPYDLLGRWRRGLDGEYVYLIADEEQPERVRIGHTRDLHVRLADLQAGSVGTLSFVAVIPAGRPHVLYLSRRFHEHCLRGQWFTASPLLVYTSVLHERLQTGDATTARQALTDALRDMDPEIEQFERLWTNGAGVKAIASLTGLRESQVLTRRKHLREMGFHLAYRGEWRTGVPSPLADAA